MSDSSYDPRRILWLCRRGTKELDVLLERFVNGPYTSATPAEKQTFALLLQLPDEELAAYLFGNATPEDPAIASLAQLIARHRADTPAPAPAPDCLADGGERDRHHPRTR
jgi:antitoxin CptB